MAFVMQTFIAQEHKKFCDLMVSNMQDGDDKMAEEQARTRKEKAEKAVAEAKAELQASSDGDGGTSTAGDSEKENASDAANMGEVSAGVNKVLDSGGGPSIVPLIQEIDELD